MPDMERVNCSKCGKFLAETDGALATVCPRCKAYIRFEPRRAPTIMTAHGRLETR